LEPTGTPPGLDSVAVHALRNQLAVILGHIELVLHETSETDVRRESLLEILRAAQEAARIARAPSAR
jgi:hypothetical protein